MEDFITKKIKDYNILKDQKYDSFIGILKQIRKFCDNLVIESTSSDIDSYNHVVKGINSLREFVLQNEQVLISDISDINLLNNIVIEYNKDKELKASIENDPNFTQNPNKTRSLGERPEKLSKVRAVKNEMDS
jgi:hypothetical protein